MKLVERCITNFCSWNLPTVGTGPTYYERKTEIVAGSGVLLYAGIAPTIERNCFDEVVRDFHLLDIFWNYV